MFKILHTADLHLGKVFHDQSLDEDQAAMLEDLASILEDESYAALVIAGDIYDRSIPSPDAVSLFGSFLVKVKRRHPDLELFVIPGNHDSAVRLGFGRELFARLGLRFGVCAQDCDKPVIVGRDGEHCAFFLLPFLNPGDFDGPNPVDGAPSALRSQSALAEEAARRMEKARQEWASQAQPGPCHSVLLAHLLILGSQEAGSERVFIGNAEHVSASLFRGFDYIALGHLHRCQRAGGNAWYPGSPLAYSFSEAGQEKFFLSVLLSDGGAMVEKIPVKPLRKVTSLSGPFARFSGDHPKDPSSNTNTDKYADTELLAAKDDYLEIQLTDRGITENARDLLRKRFPYLLSLRQDEALAGLSLPKADFSIGERPETGRKSVSADFRDFLVGLYGRADEIELELFDALLAETESEDTLS